MNRTAALFLALFAHSAALAQWIPVGAGLTGPVTGTTMHGAYLFVSTNVGNGEGVYRSTDNGLNFESARGNLSSRRITTLFSNGSRLFAGRTFQETGGFQFSTDGGATWNSTTGVGWTPSYHFANGGTLYASGQLWTYSSTDAGSTWQNLSTGLPASSIMSGLASIGTSIFLSYYDGSRKGVLRSTAAGQPWSWTNNGLGADTSILGLGVNGTILLAFTANYNIYHSTDNGNIWTLHTSSFPRLNGTTPVRVYWHNNAMFVALRDSIGRPGVYTSVDGGLNWVNKSQGLTVGGGEQVYLGFDATYAYLGTGSSFFYRRPLSEVTSVERIDMAMPSGFVLDQNYPNPFNPSTRIKFHISTSGHVMLKVYDLLGREVATLVDEQKVAGTHEIEWNAPNMASGMYFYRLQAGNVTMTRNMLLLK